MSDYYCLPFSSHPLRDQLYEELHARPFRAIATPQQISHLAFKATPQELDRAFELVCQLCDRFAVEPRDETMVSFWQDCGPFTIRWERHMEFYALTLARKEGGHCSSSGCSIRPHKTGWPHCRNRLIWRWSRPRWSSARRPWQKPLKASSWPSANQKPARPWSVPPFACPATASAACPWKPWS